MLPLKKYRVFVRGSNFIMPDEDSIDKIATLGFYTTRYIEASSPAEAEEICVQLMKEELIDYVHNERHNPPILYVEEIVEIESFDGIDVPGEGRTWFTENNELDDVGNDI